MNKLIALLFLLITQNVYAKTPFQLMSKNGIVKPQQILLETNETYIVRTADAKDSDFDNVYWVNLEGVDLKLEDLNAEVMSFRKSEFAIVRANPEQVEELSHELHHEAAGCGHLIRLSGDQVSTDKNEFLSPVARFSSDIKLDIQSELSSMKASDIRESVELLSSFRTRHHTTSEGIEASYEVKRMFETIAAGRSDISISLFDHGSETEQKSVVVRITGKTSPNEIVILGSHLDSIAGWWGSSDAPGADDNASGTATNMTVLKAIVDNNMFFDRTIEIHAYAAEEVGLVGSMDMAAEYKKRDANVVSMLQNDMNLYPAMGSDGIWLVTNDTSSELNKDLAKFINGYVGVKWKTGRLRGGSSDHASWHRQGYKVAFPFEHGSSYNPDIHTKRDVISSKLSFTQSLAFGKLSLSYLAHYAGIIN